MGMHVHPGVLWIVGILVTIPIVNTRVGTDKMLIAIIVKNIFYKHSYCFETQMGPKAA